MLNIYKPNIMSNKYRGNFIADNCPFLGYAHFKIASLVGNTGSKCLVKQLVPDYPKTASYKREF